MTGVTEVNASCGWVEKLSLLVTRVTGLTPGVTEVTGVTPEVTEVTEMTPIVAGETELKPVVTEGIHHWYMYSGDRG